MHAHLMEQFISVIISFTSSTLVSLWLLTSFQRVFFFLILFFFLVCFALFCFSLCCSFFSLASRRGCCVLHLLPLTMEVSDIRCPKGDKNYQELLCKAQSSRRHFLDVVLKKKQMKFHFKNCLFSGYSDAFLCFWLFVLICCTET